MGLLSVLGRFVRALCCLAVFVGALGAAERVHAVPGCPAINTIDSEGQVMYLYLGTFWETGDLDSNGMIDSWEAAVVAHVVCDSGHPLHGAVRGAFDSLVSNLELDAFLRGTTAIINPVKNAIACNMLVSWGLTNRMVARFNLSSGYYAPYIHPSGVVPFSHDADLDGDTFSNKAEYNIVTGVFGSRSSYVQAAVTGIVPANPVPGALPGCPAISAWDSGGEALYLSFGKLWGLDDLDGNGIIDSWEAAAVGYILCTPTHPLYGEVAGAYITMLDVMRRDPQYYLRNLAGVDGALAALLLVSGPLNAEVRSRSGLSSGLYVPFVHLGTGVQPFSATADPDGDTLNNKAEYDAVQAVFGARTDYAREVFTPKRPEGLIVRAAEAVKYLYEHQINIPFVDPICLLCEDVITADLDQNGIPDYANAFLLDALLTFADTPHFAAVAGAFLQNEYFVGIYINQLWAALSAEYGVPVEDLGGLFIDFGKVKTALTALVTFGENGSAAAMVAVLSEYAIEVDVSVFSTAAAPYLTATGDADDDGVCNLSEFLATGGANAVDFFLFGLNAVNPAVVANGGGCDGEENNNGEEPATCPVLPAIDVQGAQVYGLFPKGWELHDLDQNGMIDSWEVAVLATVLCDPSHPEYLGARKKFTGNLDRLRREPQHDLLAPAETLLAALATTSSTLASAIKSNFGLKNNYFAHRTPPGTGEQVFSGGGDPDGDTLPNKLEYNRVVAREGERADYVREALTPLGGNVDRCIGACEAAAGACANVDFDDRMRQVDIALGAFASQLGGYTFDPGGADINGGFNIALEEIYPNGILDSDEFALINYYLTQPDLPGHAEVCSGWNKNLNQITGDLGGANGLILSVAPTLRHVLAAYMLIGDDNSVNIPVTAMTEAANASIPLGVKVPNLANYTRLPQLLAPMADPDQDGFTNLEEYTCFRLRSRCCYLIAATTASEFPSLLACAEPIDEEGEGSTEGTPEGAPEGEGEEGEGEGEGGLPFECPWADVFQQEGAAFYVILGVDWASFDVDKLGIPDAFDAELAAQLLCATGGPYASAIPADMVQTAIFAFETTRDTLRAEEAYASFGLNRFENVLAALFLSSPKLLADWSQFFGLGGEYSSLVWHGKPLLSPLGDPDGDGARNLSEYLWVKASAGTRQDYAHAALKSNIGPGPDPIEEGEGEGAEGESEGEGMPEGAPEGGPDEEGELPTEGEGGVEGEEEGAGEGEGEFEGGGEGEQEGEGCAEGHCEEGEGEGEWPGRQSADQDGDYTISLSELLRVIQFYNAGGLHCADPAASTEDGYQPGPGQSLDCVPHTTDYNPQDWQITISEILRLIQFYNTGAYHPCPNSAAEDGFCPGPAPAV